MRIVDLLNRSAVLLSADIGDKQTVIETLIELQDRAGNLTDKKDFRAAIFAREKEGNTAIGGGIAIPHAKSAGVKRAGLAAITVANGVDCGAADGAPTQLFFMIAAPREGSDTHLTLLSRLTVLLMDEEVRGALLAAATPDDFFAVLNRAEEVRFGKSPETDTKNGENECQQAAHCAKDGANSETDEKSGAFRVLAVTACPTGIAHTYMAAEALTKAAAEMGISLKVETDGSGGAKNKLTRAEIEAAECIIVAADREVEMARFSGKRLVKTGVAKGIHAPHELLSRAVSGTAPVFDGAGASDGGDEVEGEHLGRRIYKYLMNGVSHMLPFVIGGGIMTAIAFLIDTMTGAPADSMFGSHSPVAAFFKGVGGITFGFMLPVLAAYIAAAIADRPGLVVGFTGGAIATVGSTFAAPTGDSAAVSGFLGALLAGFVGGIIVLFLRRAAAYLPRSMEGIKPVLIYPLFGVALIGVFMCAVNPAVGWLNTAITNGLNSMGAVSRVALGTVLGGMMAIDMGGPFNKAAYVFGTAAIAAGSFDIMAAVMVGGMVPPLAIALATTFFGNRFTETERKSGPVNYVMGLCFITEGAIPYAAADPLRVLPACIVGSGLAGALSMAFGCTLRAPHGGIFVFPVVGNVLWYFVSLAAGAAVGALLLGVFKKRVRAAREG